LKNRISAFPYTVWMVIFIAVPLLLVVYFAFTTQVPVTPEGVAITSDGLSDASGAGGTDAGRFHTAKGGTPCIGIAVPCRYIHSPVSVMDIRDYENLLKLVKEYVK